MLPSMRQRLIISIATLLGAVAWLLVREPLMAADGSSGLSLFSARLAPVWAVALVALAGVPAVALGLFASATGNLLSGIFAVTLALTILAIAGGPIDGWMLRSTLPDAYGGLIVETAIWQIGLLTMIAVVQTLRSPMRTRLPALAFSDHLGIDAQIRFPQMGAIFSGAISAVVAAVGAYLLIRSSDEGQVAASLFIAFAIGGAVGHMVVSQSNPLGILMSPAIVAVAAYGHMMYHYQTHHEVLAAWYTQAVPGPALVLPIFYNSAAVAGAAMGVGAAQAIIAGSREPARSVTT